MSIRKEFEKWISRNFKGLSAHTLYQFLTMETWLPLDYAQNMVYVDLYHVFTKQATETEYNSYETCKDMVDKCAWL